MSHFSAPRHDPPPRPSPTRGEGVAAARPTASIFDAKGFHEPSGPDHDRGRVPSLPAGGWTGGVRAGKSIPSSAGARIRGLAKPPRLRINDPALSNRLV